MKKKLFFLPLFALAIFIVPYSVSADTAHPQCDNLNGTQSSQRGAELTCVGATLGENLTLYGIEMQVAVNTGTFYVWAGDAVDNSPAVQLVGQVSSGTGYQSYYFDTPIVFTSADRPTVFVSASSTAPVGATPNFTTWGYAGPTNSQYQQYYFSPSPDGDDTTHVVEVITPQLFATTTSPVNIEFSYQQSSSNPQIANGYKIDFVHTLTYQSFSITGSLDSAYVGDGVYLQSTTTPIATSGTWKMTVSLIDWSPDVPSYPQSLIDAGVPVLFGIDYHDNVQTVVFGPTYQTYASTTCQLNLSGTFDLGQCIGYLTMPTSASVDRFKQLTLENSFPFAYAYDIGQMRLDLFDSPHAGTTTIAVTVPGFGTITFLSASMISAVPYASTIKFILGCLIWLMGIEFIYYTVIRSHNTNTATAV